MTVRAHGGHAPAHHRIPETPPPQSRAGRDSLPRQGGAYLGHDERVLRPIGARVIVRLLPDPETTESGLLYVPETARPRPQRGLVEAVGPGREFPSGYVAHSGLSPGDEVYFTRWADLPVEDTKSGDASRVAVSQEEVLCVVERS